MQRRVTANVNEIKIPIEFSFGVVRIKIDDVM